MSHGNNRPRPSSKARERKPLPRAVRFLLIVVGLIATGLGALGVILPVLPTTPFILLAAAAFMRSSERLHRKLTQSRRFGPALERIRTGQGFSLKTKVISTTVAAAALGGFALFGTDQLWLRLTLAGVLLAKIVVMALIPTYRPMRATTPFRVRTRTGLLLLTLAVGVAGAILNVALAVELGQWVWQTASGGPMVIPRALFLILLGRITLTLLSGVVGGAMSERARLSARETLFQSVAAGGPDMVREHGVGTLHTLLNERVEALDPYFGLYLPQLFTGLLAPLAVIGYLFQIDPVTGLLLLAVLPVVPFLLGMVQKRFRIVGKQYAEASRELNALYLDSLRSLNSLTIFARVRQYAGLLRERSGRLRNRTIRLLATNQLALLLVEVFFSLAVIGVSTLVGIHRFNL